MKFFLYSNLRAVQGKLIDIYEGEFLDFCKNHCLENMQKKDDFPLFTFSLFGKSGNNRLLANISSVDNLVLDFDNEKGISNEDDILRELSEYTYIYYQTFSHTENKSKFRIILPFSKSLDKESFEVLKSKILFLLNGFLDGLDTSCFNLARAFYVPTPNKNAEFNKGIYFNECRLHLDKDLTEAKQIILKELSRKEAGRNNNLKSQAFAAFNQGKSIIEVVNELVSYDKLNHNPPFFEDPSENHYVKNDSLATAFSFVSNLKRTFERNNQNTITVQAKDILNDVIEDNELLIHKYDFLDIENKYLKAPGLVGELAEWMNENSLRPLPSLSLASSLTLVALAKSHRVRSETDLRTNLFTVGLARSGGGKESSMSLAKLVLEECGLKSKGSGDISSPTSLFQAISESGNESLFFWPEVGQALQSYTKSDPKDHRSQVIKELLNLFSNANSSIIGKRLAYQKRVDLESPCVSIYGSSVCDEFINALSSSHGSNGFLARWLIFGTNKKVPKNPNYKAVDIVPPYFISEINQIRTMSTNVYNQDERTSANDYLGFKIKPKTIPYSPEAKKLILELDDYFDTKIENLYKEGQKAEQLESLWQRAVEHIIKVSLVICNNSIISKEDVLYSYNLVNQLLSKSVYLYSNFCFQDTFSKKVLDCLETIKKAGRKGISATDFYNQHRLPKQQRDDVLINLIDSGQVVKILTTGSTKPINRLIYSSFLKDNNNSIN